MLNFHSELIFFVDDLWEFAAKSSCRHCNLKKKTYFVLVAQELYHTLES